MNKAALFGLIAGCFVLVPSGEAHRVEGVLQSTLVEILPDQVNVEITFELGIDSATSLIKQLDTNRDGFWTSAESTAWTEAVLRSQALSFDSTTLIPTLVHFQSSPLQQLGSGHAQIKVQYSAALPGLSQPAPSHSLIVSNGCALQGLTSDYQIHGIVPKSPGIRVLGYKRDEQQRSIALETLIDPSCTNRSSALHVAPIEGSKDGP